jgi:uncharacterized phage protein gp47/JayE
VPFERPTLTDLVTRISADIKSRLSLVSPALRRSVRSILARVFAGAVHMLHGHLEYLGRQLFADQSDDVYLVRQASLYGLSKSPATFATGAVVLTGSNGTSIPAGTVLRRADDVEYTTQYNVTISLGTAAVDITAVLADTASNADAGTVLTFESPISGADAEATVTGGGLVGGADQETTEALRTRLLQYLRNPPEGGAEEDYRTWALAVAGVTRVWVYPRADGAGTVTVRFMRDNDVGSGFPSGGEVTEVQTYIDERRPVTAAVTVLAPVAKTWNFTIAGTPDTADVRAAVEAEIADLFLREGEPGETIKLWKVEDAINDAAGLTDYTLTSPAADLTHAAGELPAVGTFTWS